MVLLTGSDERAVFGPAWAWIIFQAAVSTVAGLLLVVLVRTGTISIAALGSDTVPIVASLLAFVVLRLLDRPVLTINRATHETTLTSGWVPLLRKRVSFQRAELSDVLVERNATDRDDGNPWRVVLLAASGAGYVLSSGQDLQSQLLASQVRNAIFGRQSSGDQP